MRADGQTTSAGAMAGVKLLLEEDNCGAKLQRTIGHQAEQTGGEPEMSLGERLLIKALRSNSKAEPRRGRNGRGP